MQVVKFKSFLEHLDETVIEGAQVTDCYSKSITLMGCLQYEINVVDFEGVKAGVLFCERKKMELSLFSTLWAKPLSSTFIKEQIDIDEFWFVFVEEEWTRNVRVFDDFIEEHDLRGNYNKIFSMSLVEPTIRHLAEV